MFYEAARGLTKHGLHRKGWGFPSLAFKPKNRPQRGKTIDDWPFYFLVDAMIAGRTDLFLEGGAFPECLGEDVLLRHFDN